MVFVTVISTDTAQVFGSVAAPGKGRGAPAAACPTALQLGAGEADESRKWEENGKIRAFFMEQHIE